MSLTYEVAANWKMLAENYNECYHCGVHPERGDLVTGLPARRRLEWADGIPHRDGAWTFTMTGTSTRPAFAGLDDVERVRHKRELISPNLLLSLAAEHVAAFRLVPSGPAVTTVVCDVSFHPDAMADDTFDWTPSNCGISSIVGTGRSARAFSEAWRRGRGPVAGAVPWRTTPPTLAGGIRL